MSTVNIVILNGYGGSGPGMDWGLALDHVPSIETPEAQAFLDEHCDEDDPDTYALVVSDELWHNDFVDWPYFVAQVPQAEADALTAAINDADQLRTMEES